MKRIHHVIFLALVLTLNTRASTPTNFPKINVTTIDNPAPGNLFLSNFTQEPDTIQTTPFLIILNNYGQPLKYKELTSSINMDFKVQPDGSLTYYQMFSTNLYSTNNQAFWFLDTNLNPTGKITAVTTNAQIWRTDVHELRMQTNGHGYLLAYRFTLKDMRPYGGLLNAILIDMAIQEVDPDGNLYWHWNPANFFNVENATPDISRTERMIDFAHCNSIDIDTDGHLLLSTRYFDEITKINRNTGAIIWRLGGTMCSNNQFTFTNDDQPQNGGGTFTGFSHQHAPRRLKNGHILLFDNGNLKNPPTSRIVEYELNETAKTATKVWEYEHTPPIQSTEMGNAQRLENGNTLICWGGNTNGTAVTEVTPDKQVMFEMTLPHGVHSYRAYRLRYPTISAATHDFDGDGRSDIGCYDPPAGWWYIYKSRQGFWTTQYGYTGTEPISGDFDGDGYCDYGVYAQTDGAWNISRSSAGPFSTHFGYDGTTPITGDFDGDGKADFGCYYPTTGDWYIYKSHIGFWTTRFGYAGTQPIAGDFDGDGISDYGIYSPPAGAWAVMRSSAGLFTTHFGYEGTLPIVGDFDGDGKADFGCYYPPSGSWYVFRSADQQLWTTQFGYSGTSPIVGDYDGDGISDFGCYYPPGGNWYIFRSSDQQLYTTQFGYTGTTAIQ